MTFKEFMEIFKFWKEVEENPDLVLPAGQTGGGQAGTTGFSEADLEEAEKKAAEKAKAEGKAEAEAEFAEKERKKAKKRRETEITEWYDAELEKGTVLPAWGELGLKEFMLSLDAEEEIVFSEEDKVSRLDWFKSFMEELPKTVKFGETATRKKDVVGSGSAGEKIDGLVKEKMEKKDLDYGTAFSEVQKENPDLATEYASEMKEVA